MRGGLALAIFVSLSLIGAASWSRFAGEKRVQPSLAVVEKNLNLTDEDVLKAMMEPSTASTTIPQANLSDTDKLGRQMITDYVALAASGEASDASLDALANKYADSIPALQNTDNLSSGDIKVVADNKANFQNYASQLTKIYTDYSKNILGTKAGGTDPTVANPALYSAVATLSSIYRGTALKLKEMSVPTALTDAHLKLVNMYILNATAMEAVSHTQEDSSKAFSGLIALNSTLDNEQSILSEISQILTSHGI